MRVTMPRHTRQPLEIFSLAVTLVAVPALMLASQGCDSNVQVEDGEECCLMDPQCPDDAVEVETCSSEQCFTVEACCTEKLCEPAGQCTLAPACEGYETEVASCESNIDCRAVTACGVTIYCQAEVFCGEVPVCDPGDTEVTECLEGDAGCYVATACGASILCSDSAFPQHGCPQSPPIEGDGCGTDGLICDYPTNGDCFESWSCQFVGEGSAWTFVGGGCPDG